MKIQIALAVIAFMFSAPMTPSASGAGSLPEGMNDFACEFYKQVKGTEGKNLFFSPYSIQSALGMTYGGAKGETAKAMAKALRFPFTGKKLHQAMGGLMGSLNKAGRGGTFELAVANALLLDKKDKLLKSFVELNRSFYAAGLESLDFRSAAERARKHINAWVERQTKDRIKDLLQKGDVDRDTSLVLTNAIYFKGQWAAKFDKARTRKGPFFLADGKRVRVPLMHQKGKFELIERPDFQMLRLPYLGGRLSMWVFLSRKHDGLAALEKRLGGVWLKAFANRPFSREVHVTLPRFSLSQDFDLSKTLGGMGMGVAFGGQADFSGMTGKRGLFIAHVLHKAYVEVDEAGTKAAAATAVVMTKGASIVRRPLTFKADHPFLFAIVDDESGAILFMGRVMDPSK